MVIIIASVAGLIVGAALGYLLFRYVLKQTYNQSINNAKNEAEAIKSKKLLEVKEKFLNKKAELEKEVAQRNSKLQQIESRLKQREISLNQRHEELIRKKQECDSLTQSLETKIANNDKKRAELEELQSQERTRLEAISGLSADEAKEHLMESMKDEARTQAQQYINEIVDDAKMTANKEAKRIVIQSIQRVATETAIENSVTVFHLESDEIKGRVIGREGRNIRALEAATGTELVVDDTPEGTYRRSSNQGKETTRRRNHRNR